MAEKKVSQCEDQRELPDKKLRPHRTQPGFAEEGRGGSEEKGIQAQTGMSPVPIGNDRYYSRSYHVPGSFLSQELPKEPRG